MSDLLPCCQATAAYVRAHAVAASCPDCGEQYGPIDRVALVPAAPTVEAYAPRRGSQPGAQPDARVQVADEGRLRVPTSETGESIERPSRPGRVTSVEDAELVRVRRLLCDLRPDRGGPLGWAPDGQPPAPGGSNWTPVLRVQTSPDVPSILPGAFASQAPESRAPRLDPDSTLGWLQRHGTLAAGLRALYALCAEARAPVDVRARWAALPGRERLAGVVVYGRKLVLAAMAEWWRESPPVDEEALRSAQVAAVASFVAREAERASVATGEALAEVRGRMAP
ncbi:MAG: hypothetical protein Q8S73_43045 [Deltaproteobacteria bacterium]|nr:hypothetical protein [Myxococcales bacterium]MDP3220940.1 hypothetical protein [Deltaproteobacteria bacterium]